VLSVQLLLAMSALDLRWTLAGCLVLLSSPFVIYCAGRFSKSNAIAFSVLGIGVAVAFFASLAWFGFLDVRGDH
jgi:hypothetical protein